MEELTQTLVDRTHEVWAAAIQGDTDFYRNFLTDDAVRVDGSGIADKLALIQQLEKPATITNVTVKDPKSIALSPESAVLIYKAIIHVAHHGRESKMSDYVTTVFVKHDGTWKGVLQQHSHVQQT
ncbi:MAG TPA: nuclear transport factor 2 family protein [Verrucomicrobiae bacterium]|nr:nuclear transport factor 2 family protein [Verrucomicrobiae bacterium]